MDKRLTKLERLEEREDKRIERGIKKLFDLPKHKISMSYQDNETYIFNAKFDNDFNSDYYYDEF